MPITTFIIIGLTAVISWIAFSKRDLMERLILWPPAVNRGQYYRLISYGFVHADMSHLLFNMVTLFFFGAVMESLYQQFLGPFGFAIFYLLGLLASILPTYLVNRHNANYRSLGASGAVSAVLFAFILIDPWATILVFFVPLPAIIYAVLYVGYSIYMDRRGSDHINHSAHLWGAAYGIVFTILIEPRVLALFMDRVTKPHFGL